MKYLILILAITLTGCAGMLDKSSDSIAKSINRYCFEVNPLVREALRQQVNLKLNGNAAIRIQCLGD